MPVKPARRQRKCCQETRSLDKRKRQTSRIWLYRIYITISHITDYSELLSVLSFVWTTDDVKVSEKELPGKRGRYCDIMAALRTGAPPLQTIVLPVWAPVLCLLAACGYLCLPGTVCTAGKASRFFFHTPAWEEQRLENRPDLRLNPSSAAWPWAGVWVSVSAFIERGYDAAHMVVLVMN